MNALVDWKLEHLINDEKFIYDSSWQLLFIIIKFFLIDSIIWANVDKK